MRFCCRGVRGSRVVASSFEDYIHKFSRIFLSLNKKDLLALDDNIDTIKNYLRNTISEVKFFSMLGIGNNTPCVEMLFSKDKDMAFIFDMGSGSTNIALPESVQSVHVFFSHFHYDHIIGLPFSQFLQRKELEIHFYSPMENFETLIYTFLDSPFFPIGLDTITNNQTITFHHLNNKKKLKIRNKEVTWKELNHPGKAYAFKVVENEKSFCYFTDVSISNDYFIKSKENETFFQGIDTIIIDSSLNFFDSIKKQSWGHTSIYEGINLAHTWGIKDLYLFHYDPEDTEVESAIGYQTALWYNKLLRSDTNVFFSNEEQWIKV